MRKLLEREKEVYKLLARIKSAHNCNELRVHFQRIHPRPRSRSPLPPSFCYSTTPITSSPLPFSSQSANFYPNHQQYYPASQDVRATLSPTPPIRVQSFVTSNFASTAADTVYSHVPRSPPTALVTSAYSNHTKPTSFKHSRSVTDQLPSQSVSHDFDPLSRQTIPAPVSAYLFTGTSHNVPGLSIKDGLLGRAVNDPIVHGQSLNVERSAVAALPTSRKYLEPVNDTNLQNQCALPAILSVIPDSRSFANVFAAIPVIADHSHNAQPLAYAPNALSLGDPHVLTQDIRASNTSMRASLVLTLAAPLRSPPAKAKPTSAFQPSFSAPSFLAPDSSPLMLQAPPFKVQLLPIASPGISEALPSTVPTIAAPQFTTPKLTVQKPASPSFTAMFSPSALPLSDPQTAVPMFQETLVAVPPPSASTTSNPHLPSSDGSSGDGSSNLSESIRYSTTCQPPGKPPGESEYYPSKEKHLQFCLHVNPCFSLYRGDPEVGISTPIRIIDQTPTRRRNRLKTGSYSLVTLPEAKRDESNDEQLDQLEETVEDSCPSVELKGPHHCPQFYIHTIVTVLSPIDHKRHQQFTYPE